MDQVKVKVLKQHAVIPAPVIPDIPFRTLSLMLDQTDNLSLSTDSDECRIHRLKDYNG